jgi:hypothetical protein
MCGACDNGVDEIILGCTIAEEDVMKVDDEKIIKFYVLF